MYDFLAGGINQSSSRGARVNLAIDEGVPRPSDGRIALACIACSIT
ncbi:MULTISPECIES: hypothetical protein [Nostocales]|uniref:Uncharacterized protein n=3 Tax=Nostocales TaxID=1161 RepID=A0A8S9T8M4_9CYAN|nr:hypothetical protein [Tolypothrix bouteillei]KAF3888024.1 hypothetical protein DA73_0400022935 [Tolypothrix bouteillei VB521301]